MRCSMTVTAVAEGILPQDGLWERVIRTYDAAQSSGAATMTQTQVGNGHHQLATASSYPVKPGMVIA